LSNAACPFRTHNTFCTAPFYRRRCPAASQAFAQKRKGLDPKIETLSTFHSATDRKCRFHPLVKQAKQVGQLVVPTDREERTSTLLFRWSRSRSNVSIVHRSRSRWSGFWSVAGRAARRASRSTGATPWTTSSPAGWLAAINNLVATKLESFFSFVANVTIAVSQSSSQSFNSLVAHAAAAITTNLVADFVCSFSTNPLVAIVQSVDKSGHDFWIAVAIEIVTQSINRFRTMFGVAGSLRRVDQLSDFAGVCTATIVAAASTLGTAGRSTSAGTWCSTVGSLRSTSWSTS